MPKRRLPLTSRRYLLPGVLLAAVAVLGGCNLNFAATPGATSQSHDEFRLWQGMMIAGFIVAIFVWLLIFWSVFRYRRRKGDTSLPKQFHEHIALEWTYTIIPLIMVGIIFYFTVIVENKVDNTLHKPAAIINVTGFQWGWRFQYSQPGNGSVVVATALGAAPSALAQPYTDTKLYPQIVLPVGETTRFFLRSTDVIHGFYVHDFNFSRYVQPGVVNQFEVTPNRTGVFYGQCTQYCGLYHSEMLFSVKIVSVSEFAKWISQHSSGSTQLGRPAS